MIEVQELDVGRFYAIMGAQSLRFEFKTVWNLNGDSGSGVIFCDNQTVKTIGKYSFWDGIPQPFDKIHVIKDKAVFSLI